MRANERAHPLFPFERKRNVLCDFDIFRAESGIFVLAETDYLAGKPREVLRFLRKFGGGKDGVIKDNFKMFSLLNSSWDSM